MSKHHLFISSVILTLGLACPFQAALSLSNACQAAITNCDTNTLTTCQTDAGSTDASTLKNAITRCSSQSSGPSKKTPGDKFPAGKAWMEVLLIQ